MTILQVLFTRTAILLYISLAACFAMYNGYLVNKESIIVYVPKSNEQYLSLKDMTPEQLIAFYATYEPATKPVKLDEKGVK